MCVCVCGFGQVFAPYVLPVQPLQRGQTHTQLAVDNNLSSSSSSRPAPVVSNNPLIHNNPLKGECDNDGKHNKMTAIESEGSENRSEVLTDVDPRVAENAVRNLLRG